MISPIPAAVGRKQINHEQLPARFPEGTRAAIDSVMRPHEGYAGFLREAVEHEIARRRKSLAKKAQPE